MTLKIGLKKRVLCVYTVIVLAVLFSVILLSITEGAQPVFAEETPETKTISIPLKTGWNYLAIPIEVSASSTAESIFAPIKDSLVVVSVDTTYDKIADLTYTPTGPLAQTTLLSTISPRYGYEVKVTKDVTLEVTGLALPKQYSLSVKPGWNLLPYLLDTEQTPEIALRDSEGSYTLVQGIENGTAVSYDVLGNTTRTLQTLKPGKSYWVYMTKEGSVNYNSAKIRIFDIVATPSETSAALSWKTHVPANGIIHYFYPQTGTKTFEAWDTTLLNTYQSDAHTATLSSLKANTTYFYTISAETLADATPTVSPVLSFTTKKSSSTTTPPTTGAPAKMSNQFILSITDTSATFSFETDVATTGFISYSITKANQWTHYPFSSEATKHTILVPGLKPGTTYDYTIQVKTSSNAETKTGVKTFTTTAETAPMQPFDIIIDDTWGQKGNAVSVTLSIPHDTTIKEARIYRSMDSKAPGALIYTLPVTYGRTYTFIDTWVIHGQSYYYTVKSVNTSNVESVSTAAQKASPKIPGNPISPTASEITVNPAQIPADGKTKATVATILRDAKGKPISNKTVQLSLITVRAQIGIIEIVRNKTDASGKAEFTLHATNPGVELYSASSAGVMLTNSIRIEYLSPLTLKNSQSTQAQWLVEENITMILEALHEKRDTKREYMVRTHYLTQLLYKYPKMSPSVQNQITTFIAYGISEDTKRLGLGERAAVVFAYEEAFHALPDSQKKIEDLIAIAHGRWPVQKNSESENRALAEFKRIYNRDAAMTDAHDNAAVTIMAYGLRQRSQDRNIENEKRAIATFKSIYTHAPHTTFEWNVVHAIAYSGAKKR